LHFDYYSLAALAAIVRTGSFEAAAKSLQVTQSAISQRIKNLEDSVGSVLIIRGRPNVPTETGLYLYNHFQQIELLQEDVVRRLAGEGAATGPIPVRVSANFDSLATWFPHVVKEATEALNIRIEVLSDDQEFTEHRLRSGEALAALSASRAEIPGCRRTELGSMEYVAVATPEFVDRHFENGVTVEAVENAPSIAFDAKDTLPDSWLIECFGVAPKLMAHQIPSYEGHLICCENSVGWAIMPVMTVGPMIEAGDLIDLSPGTAVSVSLSWYSSRQSFSVLSDLSDIVETQAKKWLRRNPPLQ
jgi:LysR family transcriptional regulator, chromosome initiation inhibitor